MIRWSSAERWRLVVFIVFPYEVAEAMSRSERYIAPSAKKLERWRQAAAAAEQFDRKRQERLRAALKRLKKAVAETSLSELYPSQLVF